MSLQNGIVNSLILYPETYFVSHSYFTMIKDLFPDNPIAEQDAITVQQELELQKEQFLQVLMEKGEAEFRFFLRTAGELVINASRNHDGVTVSFRTDKSMYELSKYLLDQQFDLEPIKIDLPIWMIDVMSKEDYKQLLRIGSISTLLLCVIFLVLTIFVSSAFGAFASLFAVLMIALCVLHSIETFRSR